ncbi:hypothetical protein EDB89DRAFT_200189 [Lactarius sanguifluus]|nr:hypothetical protein EDB89DRAFT_200189 [Lactarius sanguifluus]
MPALIPMHNTLGALFIGIVLSSILYGVTWLQVYSYYSGHCSRDRWPLKCFVAFLMLVDSANLVIVVSTTYQSGVTNFGDYLSDASKPPAWCQLATTLSAIVLDVSVQHFYAYRIYHLGGGSPFLPAAISVVSLASLGVGVVCCAKIPEHIHDPIVYIQGLFIASLSCKVLCDVFITSGMVYYLLSNRTQFRRTNNVLNLLAIYSINCGTLHLAFVISSLALVAKYRDTLINTPSLFIMFRLSLCAFMAILNSRDNLLETLDGQDGVVVATLTQFKAQTGQGTIGPQDTIEASTNTVVPKGLPLHSVYSDTSFSASVVAFDRESSLRSSTSCHSAGKRNPSLTPSFRPRRTLDRPTRLTSNWDLIVKWRPISAQRDRDRSSKVHFYTGSVTRSYPYQFHAPAAGSATTIARRQLVIINASTRINILYELEAYGFTVRPSPWSSRGV